MLPLIFLLLPLIINAYDYSIRVSRVHAANENLNQQKLRISVISSPTTLYDSFNSSKIYRNCSSIFHEIPAFLNTNNHSFNSTIPIEFEQQFQKHWKQNKIYSSTIDIQPGKIEEITFINKKFRLSLPKADSVIKGVLLADPCSSHSDLSCKYGVSFETDKRTSWFLRSVGEEVDFWGILGDNFYDHCGDVSVRFFERLENNPILNKPLITVPGNHDFWICGDPTCSSVSAPDGDQLGYGFFQYYGQDTAAYKSKDLIYDFKTVEGKNHLPSRKNFFFYHLIGSLGTIGFSGAHSYPDSEFDDACEYFISKPETLFVNLLGHWSSCEKGCAGLSTPELFKKMATTNDMPNCRKLSDERRLFYFFGHRHENGVFEKDRGFLIGGAGMEYTGPTKVINSHYGFHLFEILPKLKQFSLYEINLASNEDPVEATNRFEQLQECYESSKSLFNCTHLPFVNTMMKFSLLDPAPTSSPTTSSAPTYSPPASTDILGITLGVIFGVLALLLLIGVFYYYRIKPENSSEEEREPFLSNQ